MRYLRRTLIVGGIALVVLIAGAWIGLRAYLASSYARSFASGRLSQAVGLPVEVESLAVGDTSSTLKFRVTEPPTTAGQLPNEILRVDSASADVTLADILLRNTSPNQLTANGVTLSLRLDRQGKLLTQLPKSSEGKSLTIPAIRVNDGALHIQQEDRAEFIITGANLRLVPDGGRMVLSGSIQDPNWGSYELKGTIATESGVGSLELTSAACSLRQNLLRTLPYIPAMTWDHLQPGGSSKARFELEYRNGGDFRYNLVFTPAGQASLHLPDLGHSETATLANIQGTVRIHDDRVDFTECRGSLADGTITVGGDVDFKPEPSLLKLRVQASSLDVTQLPPEWGLHFPKELGGKLRGQANLEVRISAKGEIDPRGGGEAFVKFTGLAVGSAEATFKLVSSGKSYRFQKTENEPPAGKDKNTSRTTPFRSRNLTVNTSPKMRMPRNARPNAHQPVASPKGKEAPSTIDATLTLRNVDIAELLKKLEITLPYTLSGQVTAKVSVTVPLSQATSPRSYKVVGRFSSPEFRVENLVVKELSAELKYDKGVLTLTSLKGKLPSNGTTVPEGSFLGTASAEIEPRGELNANLDLNRLPLAEIFKAFAGPSAGVAGWVTGKGRFQAPLEKIKDPATWKASATLTSDDLTLLGRSVRQASVELTIDQALARLTNTRASIEGLPVSLEVTLALTAPYKFQADVQTFPSQIADLRKLVPNSPISLAIEGKLQTTAKAKGTLSPLSYEASGSASATELKLGTSEGNTVELKWIADSRHIAISELTATAFKGKIGGSADIPFERTLAGDFAVTFKDLDSEGITKSLPGFPLRLTGLLSGKFMGLLPALRENQTQTITGNLDLSAPSLTVQGIPADRLIGKIDFANEAANYELEGKTLGGSFELKGSYPFRAMKPEPKENRGAFRLRGVDLQQAARALKYRSIGDLRGTADFSLDFQNDLSEGTGRFDVRGLAWGSQELASQLTGSVRLKDGVLAIPDFGGVLAGGDLRFGARLELHDPRRNFVNLSLDRADSKILLSPFASAKEAIDGQISVVYRGRLGPQTSGSGLLAIVRGSLFGFAVNDLRVPFDMAVASGDYGQLTVHDAYTQAGQGRLTGNLTFNWGPTNRLDGKIQFYDVRMRSVLAGAGQSTNLFGNGRITGRLDLGGSNIRSVNDINGIVTATLNQASVRELPVLGIIMPYVNFSGLTAPFQTGDVRGRIGGGLFRLERLALSNSTAHLYADGTISLATGRLDLDVVAATGQVGGGVRGLQLLGLRIPAFGPIPLTLVSDISQILSNRTVRLTVGGTTKNPIVRINTAALLSDEAIRFLVGRFVLGSVGISSVYSSGTK